MQGKQGSPDCLQGNGLWAKPGSGWATHWPMALLGPSLFSQPGHVSQACLRMAVLSVQGSGIQGSRRERPGREGMRRGQVKKGCSEWQAGSLSGLRKGALVH